MDETSAFCGRCDRESPVIRPWPGYRVLWRVWIVGAALIVLAAPILAADIAMMIPTAALYLLGGSTLKRLSEERTTCRRCGALIE